jgi:hypothetical protein
MYVLKKNYIHKKKLCTQNKTYVHTKKKKNVHLFYFVFFVYTNIRVNNFPLCEKACLWHALDSQFRTLASNFSYCTKMESCEKRFHSPLKNLFLLRQEISRERGLWLLNGDYKKMFLLVHTYLGGQSYCSPPFNPSNPVSSRIYSDTCLYDSYGM